MVFCGVRKGFCENRSWKHYVLKMNFNPGRDQPLTGILCRLVKPTNWPFISLHFILIKEGEFSKTPFHCFLHSFIPGKGSCFVTEQFWFTEFLLLPVCCCTMFYRCTETSVLCRSGRGWIRVPVWMKNRLFLFCPDPDVFLHSALQTVLLAQDEVAECCRVCNCR